MSKYLAEEITAAGYTIENELSTGISTRGTLTDCIRLNLVLRTAHKVLFHLKTFRCTHPDQLYKSTLDFPWEKYFFTDSYFTIVANVENETITDSRFSAYKVKDAIADRFISRYKKRPDSGPEKNKVVIFLHWKNEEASLYIDSSGETIARHGYRKKPFKAPVQESLASALIYASRWDKKSTFINPMCGSGTLAIQACLIALNRYPGLFRSNYCFMHLRDFEPSYYEKAKEEIKSAILRKLPARIIATDIDPLAIDAAKNNAATAGVDHLIEFRVCDFRDTEVPEGGGVVMINPEYGERLGAHKNLEEIYTAIGDFFKKKCAGYFGYVFTGNLDLAKCIGLKTKRRIEFYNGTIDARLLEYELYSGSKKSTPQQSEPPVS
jgi:23S rRNA G2445 N2-methylase RlmL